MVVKATKKTTTERFLPTMSTYRSTEYDEMYNETLKLKYACHKDFIPKKKKKKNTGEKKENNPPQSDVERKNNSNNQLKWLKGETENVLNATSSGCVLQV